MTETERKIVTTIISGMRDKGYVIVQRELLEHLSDYLRVNAKPENDLAQKYIAALDAVIMQP